MDYKIGLYLKGFIILTIAKLARCEIDREILLTPKHSLQINGRILYFRPFQKQNITNEVIDKIPWEQALKHVTFLTLNNHLNDANNLNELPEYKKFMNASYIPSDLYIPKFGDIITLAKGRLESNFSNGNIKFIEGLCNENCDPKNTLAFWQVEKIRHRDYDKNFRYEIRLTVNTNINSNKKNREKTRSNLENDSAQSESRNSEIISEKMQTIRNTNVKRSQRAPRILRSFILKDDDYPNSFSFLDEHLLKRHNIATRTAYLDKLNAFNDVFTQPRYFQSNNIGIENDYSKLNIGEYIMPSRTTYPTKQNIESQSRIGMLRPFVKTTFRPNYNPRFSVPNNFPYPYHFEESETYPPLNYHEQITSVPSEYNVAPNPEVTFHTHKPYGVTRKPIELHSHHHYYSSNFNENANGNRGEEHYSAETASAPPPHLTDHQSTIHLIEQPLNSDIVKTQNNYRYRTPPTIANQIPIPPSQTPVHYTLDTTYPGTPPPVYIKPTQSSQYIKYNDNENKQPENNNDGLSKNTYSSPDPLYHSDSVSNNFENSTKYDVLDDNKSNPINKFEPYNQEYYYHKPDSINAQLPPPEKGQDINVPYVDSPEKSSTEIANILSQHSEFGKKQQKIFVTPSPTTSTKAAIIYEQSTATPITKPFKVIKSRTTTKRSGKNSINSNNSQSTSSTTMKAIGERSKPYRSTTERPVLKWKAKRGKITREYPTTKSRKYSSTSSKYEFEKIHVDENIVTVTPNKISNETIHTKSKDVPTKKSIATSITYKVGRDKLQKPFKPTVKIPNVEIVEASLVKLPTPNHRDIKLFKATEEFNEKLTKDSKEDIELTETIVDHARNL